MRILAGIEDQFKNKHFYYPFAVWVVLCVWFVFFSLGAFRGFSNKIEDNFDFLNILFTNNEQTVEEISIVAIDNESLAAVSAKWPLKRSYFAELLDKVVEGGAKTVVFDFIFSGRSEDKESDVLFAQSIEKANNVFLAYDEQPGEKRLLPYLDFRNKAKGVGHVNKPVADDFVVRDVRAFIQQDDGISYGLEIKSAAEFLGEDFSFVYYKNNLLHIGDNFKIPVDETGVMSLNFNYGPGDYNVISARRVLQGNVPARFFKDKIVLFGATARVVHDEADTPLGVLSGVFIIANTLSMLLDSAYITYVPVVIDILIILLLSLFLLVTGKRFGFVYSSLTMVSVAIVWFGIMVIARNNGIRFAYGSHIFLVSGAFLVSNIYKYCYILYMSDKVKKQAVIDPVTNFYTTRYFNLMLGQYLKHGEKDLCMLAVAIHDYHLLSKKYGFDEMKGFIKSFARYLEFHIRKEIKDPIFTRSTEGRFFVLVSHYDQKKLKRYMDKLAIKIKKNEFDFGTRAEFVNVSIVVALFPEYRGVTSRKMFKLIQHDLTNMVNATSERVFVTNIDDKIWDLGQVETVEDELEFLSVDIEERNLELEKALKAAEESKRGVEETYFSVVTTLVNALEEKDTYTQGHSERAAKYAKAIATEVGLDEEESELIYKAGLLHDIGKIGIPETLLHKTGKLTDDEFDLIRKHPVMGQKILGPIKAFESIIPIVLHHHERHDGRGYPHGLNGDMIPKGAQILSVADCFDAITCGRGYKQGTSLREGMAEIERCSGTQFNPEYVEAFKRVLNLR